MTTPTKYTYTFALLYNANPQTVRVVAHDLTDAVTRVFAGEHNVEPGWHSVITCDDLYVAEPATQPRALMVNAASNRRAVVTTDGRVGLLNRWDTPKRPKTARIEVKPGVSLTFKCANVTGIDIVFEEASND